MSHCALVLHAATTTATCGRTGTHRYKLLDMEFPSIYDLVGYMKVNTIKSRAGSDLCLLSPTKGVKLAVTVEDDDGDNVNC